MRIRGGSIDKELKLLTVMPARSSVVMPASSVVVRAVVTIETPLPQRRSVLRSASFITVIVVSSAFDWRARALKVEIMMHRPDQIGKCFDRFEDCLGIAPDDHAGHVVLGVLAV